jgi:ankyrin repeat protein
MKIYIIMVSWCIIIFSWCGYSFANDDFIEQEFKYMSKEPDKDLLYSVDDIDISELDPSDDEKITWKRSQEIRATNNKKQKHVEKLMAINYMVGSYPADILNPTSSANAHLSDDANSFDYRKMALYCSAQGDINCLRVLLDHKIDVDICDQKGDSLLVKAILANQIDVVRLLLARGANVNLVDYEGSTPLHLASIKGNASIIQSLKSMGANSGTGDKFGKSSKDYARSKQYFTKQ